MSLKVPSVLLCFWIIKIATIAYLTVSGLHDPKPSAFRVAAG